MALEEAQSLGATYADIYLEQSQFFVVALQDGKVNRASTSIDYGAGVRAVKGNQSGYAFTEEVSLPTLRQAARSAARIGGSTAPGGTAKPICVMPRKDEALYDTSGQWQVDEVVLPTLVAYLERMRQRMLDREPRLVNVSASIIYQLQKMAIANSEGTLVEDCHPITNLALQCVIADGDRRERANASRSYSRGIEMLDERMLTELSDKVIEQARFALTAQQPKGGEMPVVLGAGASGILLHEAIGHAFEADCVRRGESIFTNQMDKQVCHESITVVDDGTLPLMRGSIHFDDEAVPTQCTPIVTNGVLTSFLHDRISAAHFGVAPTGNGRRESFRSLPLPRMRNTYMLGVPGTTQEQLIASVKKGIFVENFTNGQVQIGAGDYTFFVKGGYLIEDGRLTQPIKDVNIIGNGPQTLADIAGVANDLVVDPSTWTCGKEGQSVPVSCGMPSVLVTKLTVG